MCILISHKTKTNAPTTTAPTQSRTVAVGHELLEDVGEVLGDAAEGADDGLVLLPVQVLHQRLDGRRALVQVLL